MLIVDIRVVRFRSIVVRFRLTQIHVGIGGGVIAILTHPPNTWRGIRTGLPLVVNLPTVLAACQAALIDVVWSLIILFIALLVRRGAFLFPVLVDNSLNVRLRDLAVRCSLNRTLPDGWLLFGGE